MSFKLRGTSQGRRGGVCRHTEKGPLEGDTEGTTGQPSWSIREEVPSQSGLKGEEPAVLLRPAPTQPRKRTSPGYKRIQG